jgi:cobyrinic acid a,c-diamide synthase
MLTGSYSSNFFYTQKVSIRLKDKLETKKRGDKISGHTFHYCDDLVRRLEVDVISVKSTNNNDSENKTLFKGFERIDVEIFLWTMLQRKEV